MQLYKAIVWRSRSGTTLLRDAEVRTYAFVHIASIAGLSMVLAAHSTHADFPGALRAAAFHVVSLATTTG